MTTYLPMDRIRVAAGKAAASVLPDEVAETMPVAARTADGVRALQLFYRMVGPIPHGKPTLPTHAMWLDPKTAAVVRFAAVTPEELGLHPPLDPVPGVNCDMSDIPAYLAKRGRFFDLSPGVWEAFERSATSADTATDADVKEYWGLFLQLVHPEIAPYYTGAAKDFFDWARAIAGAP